jgi:HAD superfamily hydrolase (TIGR01509 family)
MPEVGNHSPETVLFDLDDTLFDHSRAVDSALRRARELFPELRRRRLGDLRTHYNTSLFATFRRVISGSLTAEEGRTLRFEELFRYCGHSVPTKIARECGQIYRQTYQESRSPVPGAATLLRMLRSASTTIGIVTNNTREEQEEKLRVIGLDQLIDFMVTSEETRIQKPDPRIFRCALELGDAPPDRTVMVGDSWESDVMGAKGAGIHAVWLNRDGLANPDPTFAAELRSFRPCRIASERILCLAERKAENDGSRDGSREAGHNR